MIKNAQVKLLKIIILYLINKKYVTKYIQLEIYDKSLTQNTIALKFRTKYIPTMYT